MKILILLLISLSINLSLFCQTKQNGWIEVNNGDTIYGKIKQKQWNITPKEIQFEKNNGEELTFVTEDIKSFGFIDGDLFVRFKVSRHLYPYDSDVLFNEEDVVIDTINTWVKIVFSSRNLSLAALYNPNRNYFYVIRNNEINELIAGKGIQDFSSDKYKNDARYGKTGEIENEYYKNQLNLIFPNKLSAINSITYTETSLQSFFQKYTPNTFTSKSKKRNIIIGVTVGISSLASKTQTSNSASILYKSKFEKANNPFFKVFFYSNTKKNKRFNFIPDLGIMFLNTTGSKSSNIVPDIGKFII
jgi:hypothetical protein